MNELSIGELANIVDGRLNLGCMPPLGGDLEPVGRIVSDSRFVSAGEVFWELNSDNGREGSLAEEAFSRSASGVVVASRPVEPWAGRFSIHVTDSKWALGQLASWNRRRFHGQVVAVSGSVGKTTTCQLIHQVLSNRLKGTYSEQHGGDPTGVALGMLDVSADHNYAVLEISSDPKEDISSISHLCCPHFVAITRTHETHPSGNRKGDSANPARQLLASLPTDGWAVINGDDPVLRKMADSTTGNVVFVGRSSYCDVRASQVRCGDGSLSFDWNGQSFMVPVPGRHYLPSALVACAVGQKLGLTYAEIAQGLSNFGPLPGRCEVRKVGPITVVDDTCGARPESVPAALEVLRTLDGARRRIVICGELEADAAEKTLWHQRVGEHVVTNCGADVLVACGGSAEVSADAAATAGMPAECIHVCESGDEISDVLDGLLREQDAVVVTGNCGHDVPRLIHDRWNDPALTPA